MSTYKPGDSKKEEFRKYLEKAGVLDALTKTLVCLYEEPEKPNNALDFLRKNLCKYYLLRSHSFENIFENFLNDFVPRKCFKYCF
jgi:hypothetical protein